MKRNIGALIAVMFLTATFTNCSDWTEVEPEKMVEYDNTETNRPASYYESLRAYKKSDHAISFGWFSGWGENSASTTNMLAGIPDSMDIVSLWGGWSNLSAEKIADLRFVQHKKGTRVLFCSFTSVVGQNCTPEEHNQSTAACHAFWGWVDGDEEAIEGSIRKYARAIIDTVEVYKYDGFDIDYEPHYGYGGELASNNEYMHILIDELGKYIGPMSPHPEKLLIVDGEPQSMNSQTGPYISYFVIQAYTVSGGTPPANATGFESNMDSRLQTCLRTFMKTMDEKTITNRYVITENCESAIDALNGGYFWQFRDGTRPEKNVCPSLVGMARWQPTNGYRKGGFGAYQFGYEAVNKPSYKWMRTAIQMANPSVK